MLRPARGIRQLLVRQVRRGLLRLEPEDFRDWLGRLLADRTGVMAPRDGVALLLNVEKDVCSLLDRCAVETDGGIHPKHRLTRYHDFFVQRICAADRVLDVGCGCGVVARDVAERTGATVVGVDMNAGSIERANREFAHRRVRYVHGDATQALPNERFDLVILSNVLEHIRDRGGLIRRLHEQTGCGRFLIRVPLYERDWLVPLRREMGFDSRSDPTHETEYTAESFDAEMRGAGLVTAHRESRWGEIWADCLWPRPQAADPAEAR